MTDTPPPPAGRKRAGRTPASGGGAGHHGECSPGGKRDFPVLIIISSLLYSPNFSWDAAYERELQTFQDIGDAGEIWFGEESMVRIITWLEKHKVPLDSSVLDIGTGNGVLLIELAKSGYMNLTGIDYSPSAIQLSEKIREKEGMSNIKLKVEDFLTPSAELSGFDICLDKGTFDAISLDPADAAGKRKLYVGSLSRVLKPEGFFLITSCNWTKEELLNEFREGFEILDELPTPKFCFGGRIGNSVTALVFQRKKVKPSILDKLD
ncbi:EEF1A lysine methyltransferase 2 [Malurus melanocephalus]|uniref:EEF1A lysine methyltransferase 2 n=1 Tax=Malurus melanocephalus TaxID=175006 RepID=UPI002546D2DD|nr:EEF1A lysine methyltransferase 2 [Malurus melanocephalus]